MTLADLIRKAKEIGDRARDLFLIAVCAVGVSVILLTILFHYNIF